eukprot:tig00000057_g137.t1
MASPATDEKKEIAIGHAEAAPGAQTSAGAAAAAAATATAAPAANVSSAEGSAPAATPAEQTSGGPGVPRRKRKVDRLLEQLFKLWGAELPAPEAGDAHADGEEAKKADERKVERLLEQLFKLWGAELPAPEAGDAHAYGEEAKKADERKVERLLEQLFKLWGAEFPEAAGDDGEGESEQLLAQLNEHEPGAPATQLQLVKPGRPAPPAASNPDPAMAREEGDRIERGLRYAGDRIKEGLVEAGKCLLRNIIINLT